MSNPHSWRPIVAALGDPDTRLVFSQISLGYSYEQLGAELGAAKRKRTIAVLVRSGLVVELNNIFAVNDELLAQFLQAAPTRPARQGIERFLDAVLLPAQNRANSAV